MREGDSSMKRHAVSLLVTGNILLVLAAWIAALYAYPRLPPKIPLWLNLSGGPNVLSDKSLLFFLYPLIQTLLASALLVMPNLIPTRVFLPVKARALLTASSTRFFREMKKEFIYLILIFVNLVFIHLQTSLIFLAHDIEQGFNKFYFVSLFAIIILLLPYYRLRLSLLIKKLEDKDNPKN